MTEAWHFVNKTLLNGSPIPPDGEILKVDPSKLVLCHYGLHASINILDAMRYAPRITPGTTLCRVKLGGKIIKSTDKLVASERTILWRVESKDILRKFACDCALSVSHLWKMPDIVREYLTTQNNSIRVKARNDAYAAADAAAAYAAAYAAYAYGAAYAAYSAAAYAAYAAADAAYAYDAANADYASATRKTKLSEFNTKLETIVIEFHNKPKE